MIRTVSFEKSTWNEVPHKFEAGTPHMAGAVGLAAALDYLTAAGLPAVAAHERALLQRALAGLSAVPGLRLVGRPRERAGVISFLVEDVHPHDLATVVDREGVAIRAGQHCAEPLLRRLGVSATARASFALYNTAAEVDALVGAVRKAQEMFA
jgi:cysteine desulfurase/selenocysteine lyase